MPVYLLEENEIYFPDPRLAEPNGMLAVGGDLSVKRLLLAYSNGIFPWYNEGEPITWWCPKERFIIRPERIHVSRSMKKFLRKQNVTIRVNRDFSDTIHRCKTSWGGKTGTWITNGMEAAYTRLHETGLAASAEAFYGERRAGGLYGVVLGKCFFGESMFSDEENGSKAALIGLARILEKRGFGMIDCQFHTDHLQSMGGEPVSYKEYMGIVSECTGSFVQNDLIGEMNFGMEELL